MNHWTIGKKLFTAFLAVTTITLLTGLLGYYSQTKNNAAVNNLGNICMPSVQSLLIVKENAEIVKAAQRTLLSPDLDDVDRKRQPQTAAKAAAAAAAAWKVFEPLPRIAEEEALWKDFLLAWDRWEKDNTEFFKINAELEGLAILDPMALQRDLQQFVGDHYKLRLKIMDRVTSGGEAVTGGEDPTACRYGLWLAKFQTTNPELRRIIDATRPSHSAFHADVKTAKDLMAKGDKDAVLKLTHNDMEKAEGKTFEGFDAMLAEAAKATALREKLSKQLMAVSSVSLAKVLSDLEKLLDINMIESATTTKEAIAQGSALKFLNLVGMILSVAAASALGFFITRSLVKTLSQTAEALSEGSDQVASASGEIASASQSLAEGASQQAASLEETSASLEEIASMTKRNAENALNAKALSSDTRQAAETGSVAMEEMNRAMADIQSASSNISKIIKTIDEIAFQTNILALNAAVEAARAGQAGAGFAVVADEVRNLAQRSAQAAKETAEKIEDSIHKSANGVVISGKVTESLTQIVTKARQVDELVAEIATASREQTQGIEQVNTAVTQMDKVTQTNAATAEESASASEELSAQAATLRELVADLQNLVAASGTVSVSGGRREVLQTRACPPEPPNHTAATTRPALGGHRPALFSSNPSRKDSEFPLEGDFKDF